ncbi:Crp/Fnr family transcriptional regulator [Reichenbachiella ulvae]|uniref:Crp/Fnr family transcriptional regulator n=1 Tax=Reichenbachiella ulvae TaxID=2980104 RepID=A0ABT3CQF7_9BACT|nr:Crp/Fnr family transcriptional regulator [Reichenbachiella ulvae]MCV9385852.1 Crp/Fnr family transcriptional regulator [Reichenbachiella ulvae]
MSSQIKSIINDTFPISDTAFRLIEKHLDYQHLEKNTDFIVRGRKNNLEYFILNGICKSFVLNPDGKEITISFFMTQSILSPRQIRTTADRSNLSFRSLTDLEIATIPADTFENLMIENLEIRNFANTVLQQELIRKVQKEIGLASLTAKERLLAFRQDYPGLENFIPHSDIASYLGITNISLSRLRSELAR